MNRENIEKVIKDLKALRPAQFDMRDWLDPQTRKCGKHCDSVGCVAGWTVLFLRPEFLGGAADVSREARELLGLPEIYDITLFCPVLPNDHSCTEVTPAMAARVLEHLLETGEVDWSVAFQPLQVEG